MSRIILVASIAACSVLPGMAFTEKAFAESTTATEKQKADVVVTASRIEQPVSETLASVTVLDRKDIERAQALSLPELLKRQAGIQYGNTGGRGSNSTLFLRGTNGGHVLVLVDGVRVGSATLGTTSLETYSLEQIERVEIVRGPRSSLYGSEAIGGVIQIFTRKSVAPLRVSAGAGTDQSFDHSVSFSGENAKTRHAVTLTYEETMGFDNSTQDDVLDGSFSRDDDAYRNQGANLSFSHLLSERVSVDGLYNNNQGKTEFDPSSYGPDGNPFINFDNTAAALGATIDLDPLEVRTSVSRSEDKSETLSSFSSAIDTVKNQGMVQLGMNNDVLGHMVGGVEYVDELVESSQIYSQTERAVFSGFAQVQKDFGPASVQIGGRHDDNEQFGSKKTGNIGVGVPVGSSAQIYSTYGTAFKAPTFNDLYWPADDYSAGNPDLVPETSQTAELGGKWFHERQSLDLSFYKTKIKDLIQWQPDENFFYSPINVDNVRIRGVDVSYGFVSQNWIFDTQAAYTHARDEVTGEALVRRAERTLSTSIDRNFAPFSVGATWFVSSSREDIAYDDFGNTYRVDLGGYSTLDLRAAYQWNKEIQFKGSIDNVFDKNYQLADGFNTAGLGAMLHVVYTPQ